MTPINFTTFLVSLLLVDLRYSLMRSQANSQTSSYSRLLPSWLHDLVTGTYPYQSLRGHAQQKQEQPSQGRWYYHSKQKKLLKLEADEAFQMRTPVLIVLVLVTALCVTLTAYVVSRLLHRLSFLLST
ncbi:hypothetical protein S40285_07825 [Stachybotrys chlorohalonatus IBT 40285]|uniref:Uncharacterized protein n=1 Tax=Stachybotrys chlorohalonatus (strain IBT 40285) TaxID=1283841 RepID=A0A084QCI6_STAC4|nr:hypothetical protein S40285_07825 [Stachybotrys chlorohalonata IBT 40285]